MAFGTAGYKENRRYSIFSNNRQRLTPVDIAATRSQTHNGSKMARVVVLGSYGKSLTLFRGAMLREMAARGHDVVACAPEEDAALSASLAEIGVSYESYPLKRTGLNPLTDLKTLRQLYHLLRRLNPDVVLSYTIKPVIYGSIAARLSGVNTIAAMVTGLGYAFSGTSPRRRMLSAVAKGLYRTALRRARVVYFQNPDDQAAFESFKLLNRRTERVLINGSGIDVDQYSQRPLPPEGRCLLVARLLGDKGVREYAAAAKLLKQRYPEAEFHLIGWIDDNPNAITQTELDQWIAEGTLVYHGKVDDVRPYLEHASIYVLPSYYPEGTPRTILEALALGRPIVTADTPGCRETVRHEANGFLVPPRDVAALAAALDRLLSDAELRLRMGRESRALAEEKYDVRKVNRQILAALGL
ncbi:MAG: glycosyltransferase family 4 protein [Bdellovibrionales bacterium]|nr:glycosyltransferase family 4 protein [Bdellovibrionales bacterium]